MGGYRNQVQAIANLIKPFRSWNWLGMGGTSLLIGILELTRQRAIPTPTPFLLLLTAVVLSSTFGGLWTGLSSAALAVAYVIYAAFQGFGPETLTGGPLQVATGSALLVGLGLLEGWHHDRSRKLQHALQSLGSSLDCQVEQRTEELVAVNQRLLQEISDRQQIQSQLLHNSTHDGLTGMPNRSLLLQRLDLALQRLKRYPQRCFAVLFVDLDRFKPVNDSLGHEVGDQLLIAIGQRLSAIMRATDLAARLGGDEFVLLLEDLQSIDEAIQFAERVMQSLQAPFRISSHDLFISASIGIVLGHSHYQRGADLVRDADIAMYRAKSRGKARYAIFQPTMHAKALQRLYLEEDLRRALEHQEFCLYYQPLLSLADMNLVGFEALLRWQHPQHGLLAPLEFMAIAEETGLAAALGQWVLTTACCQIAQWTASRELATERLILHVNLSAQQLQDGQIIQQVALALDDSRLAAQQLVLELTEAMVLADVTAHLPILEQLQAQSLQLSLDDFGSGYSSLRYLHQMPIHFLKISRAFVQRLMQSERHQQLVATLIHLSHQLGMTAIAEGIETAEQLTCLRSLGCEFGQGYLFAKPLAPDDAKRYMQRVAHQRLA
jgi:diguanylate cyclase (GGDEF)-like protein